LRRCPYNVTENYATHFARINPRKLLPSALAGFALRAMAIWKGWAIPAYRG